MGKINLYIHVLLWGSVLIQLIPIYKSAQIYLGFPRIEDWSSAWIIYIVGMVSVAARRFFVAYSFDRTCEFSSSFIFDQVFWTYLNSFLFWWFVARKERFFLKWFSVDRLKIQKGEAEQKR